MCIFLLVGQIKCVHTVVKLYYKYSSFCVVTVLFYLYFISITFPSILSVFLYIFGNSGDIHLTLPFYVDSVLQAGSLYYSLLIYQVIAIFIVITIGITIYSLYWALIQHACAQLHVIVYGKVLSFLS